MRAGTGFRAGTSVLRSNRISSGICLELLTSNSRSRSWLHRIQQISLISYEMDLLILLRQVSCGLDSLLLFYIEIIILAHGLVKLDFNLAKFLPELRHVS